MSHSQGLNPWGLSVRKDHEVLTSTFNKEMYLPFNSTYTWMKALELKSSNEFFQKRKFLSRFYDGDR